MTTKFLFFSLKGRISRLWWWIGSLMVGVADIGLTILLIWLLGGDPGYFWNDKPMSPTIALVQALSFVLLMRLYLAIDFKRIHDRGRTAYLLVPFYLGTLVIYLLEGLGHNPFIEAFDFEKTAQTLSIETILNTGFIVFYILYTIWLVFELGILRGTKGDSKYGPDPLTLTDPPAKNSP